MPDDSLHFLAFLHVPLVVMCSSTTYLLHPILLWLLSISDAAAHDFGWDDTGGTGHRNEFRTSSEICGRDWKVLPAAFTAPTIYCLHYFSYANSTVHYLTQTGETIEHNQLHTQVDYRAFYPLSFNSFPWHWTFKVWTELRRHTGLVMFRCIL